MRNRSHDFNMKATSVEADLGNNISLIFSYQNQ